MNQNLIQLDYFKMPKKRLASAALQVLYYDSPCLWFEIFKHINGIKILLNLRLVCKEWANRMLYLKKWQYLVYIYRKHRMNCYSVFPLILSLREKRNKNKGIKIEINNEEAKEVEEEAKEATEVKNCEKKTKVTKVSALLIKKWYL